MDLGYKNTKTRSTYTSNIVEATGNFVASCFDNVAVFGNKVDRCFDIVASVDGVYRNL